MEARPEPTIEELAATGARAVLEALAVFCERFAAITRRARDRFEARDWQGTHADAAERLGLYADVLNRLIGVIRGQLGSRVEDSATWKAMKRAYSALIARRSDVEIAETFFNSLTRRIFTTVGVNRAIEFVDSDFEIPAPENGRPIWRAYRCHGCSLARLMREILADAPFRVPWADLESDAAGSGAALEEQLGVAGGDAAVAAAEVLEAPFYRNRRAYLVGRLHIGERTLPLVLALTNEEGGVRVDAALTNADEVSIVFSFARSYFHVDAERPHEIVAFLSSIMPRKPVAELYISIGYHKHGKTELYRDLLRRLAHTVERFEIAPGELGLVMIVFALPSFDMVFKVIRDIAGAPKHTSRREVIERYRLVFTHDRVGRLVDAQEFEHLRFDRARFSPALLAELTEHASHSVSLEGEHVVIRHLFTERRVVPLNLYLKEVDDGAAREVVIDLGNAIKDLAAANIFPGDLMLKNFGVTRHGRVVFYDYDELCLLEDCVFRALPPARDLDDEMSDEPWFAVGVRDIFPEELRRFLGLPPHLRDVFLARHGDLFEPELWHALQARHRAGEIIDVCSYREERRLRSRAREPGAGAR